jgi:hypothetical protein
VKCTPLIQTAHVVVPSSSIPVHTTQKGAAHTLAQEHIGTHCPLPAATHTGRGGKAGVQGSRGCDLFEFDSTAPRVVAHFHIVEVDADAAAIAILIVPYMLRHKLHDEQHITHLHNTHFPPFACHGTLLEITRECGHHPRVLVGVRRSQTAHFPILLAHADVMMTNTLSNIRK